MKTFDNVKFYYNVESLECKNLITAVISKYGSTPEHNYEYFISHKSDEQKPVFAYFGDHKGVFAIEWDDNSYQVISEVIAPEDDKCNIATRFFSILFAKLDAKKVLVEFSDSLRLPLLKTIKNFDSAHMVVGNILDRYHTPILSLKEWDYELSGSRFSKLRKAKNRFRRNFDVEILRGDELSDISIEDLEKLVLAWKKNRKGRDRAYADDYLTFFRNGFKGSACHIALRLDGRLKGVCAAWVVPNTDEKTVYYAINLHDYSVPELGDFLTVSFLDELKHQGFEYMDFGSSDQNLLKYKKKFGVHKQYQTMAYYIRRKIQS